jgi:hypothetical protein
MAMAEDPVAGWCPVLEEENCVEGYTMDDAEGNVVYYDFCSPATAVPAAAASPSDEHGVPPPQEAEADEAGEHEVVPEMHMAHGSLEPLSHHTPEGGLGMVR